MDKKIANIIVDVPVKKLDKIFHYSIPSHLVGKVRIGSRVLVSFSNRTIEGYVVGFSHQAEVAEIKEILKVIVEQPVFSEDILALAQWMAEKYACTLRDSLNCVVPAFTKKVKPKQKKVIKLAKDPFEVKQYIEKILFKAPKQAALLECLLKAGISELAVTAETNRNSLRSLVEKGFLAIESKEILRDPYLQREFKPSLPLKPTNEQKAALDKLSKAIESHQPHTFLLHGVTGSGKTEIYLQTIDKILKKNKQVIVLVPEISLTPQMVERFKSRFGSKVAVLHSRLSDGERYDEWRKINEQKVQIVVGARSAVFAPFKDLGLIIVDEEHETTYKQEENPKYHAREVAIKRAHLAKGIVILGSATPALETYYKTAQGEYKLLTLEERVENRPLPTVHVCDLREELKDGHKSIFSRLLLQKINDRILKGEQIILFLNRRGYSTFVMCRECGLVIKCPFCSIPLTYHATDNSLHCHYCQHKMGTPSICPNCSSKYIKFFGIGTQKIEEHFNELFPKVKILRMDVDTTSRKGSHERILKAFQKGEAQVLIGTQMIAKGLDFPNVTLVGVITSDTTLNLPDFRAAEKTFQILTQVAGRAGRHLKPGEVIIQTYNPEHYSIVTASNQDFLSFYQQELEQRKERNYPPFSNLIRVLISDPDETKVIHMATVFGNLLQGLVRNRSNVEVLGPAQAPIEKIKTKHRWQMLLKGEDPKVLLEILNQGHQDFNRYFKNAKVGLSIDVDPQMLL